MAKRKSERLINLVICLLAARRRLTREQIRRSVEGYAGLTDAAFLRTFERDKDELRRLGVPIETGPTDPWSDEADGYRIHRSDYELPALELTAAESTLLGLAAPVWQGAALGQATGRAIAKLRAAGAEIGGERVAAVAPALPTREPAFAAFWQSWLTRTPIRFSYHGKDRVLEPWRLQLRQGSWYVFGRDRAAGLRCYRLSRVEGAPGLLSGEAPYAAASEDELAEYARLDAEPSPVGEALLAIRPDAAPALRRRGRPTAAVPDGHEPVAVPEGYEPVAVPYSRDSEVVDEACSAGVGVIVLGPPGLRVQTLERLRQVAAAGQGASPAGRGHSAVGPAAPSAVLPPAPFAVPGRSGFNPAAPNAAAAQTPHGPVAAPDGSAGASAEQAARLLLLIPYFQSRPGQSLAEAAAAFDLPPDQLRRDLSVAFLCGLPGGLPGDLIEVDLEAVDGDGLVYLSNAEVLPRPLSLRPDEAMGLIAAVQAVREVAAAELLPVIDSLLSKLAALGPGAAGPVAVAMASGDSAVRETLAAAIARGERVRLAYGGLARGETSHPAVDPVRLFTSDGAAYLSAWSLDRADWRTYRLDRVSAVTPTGQPAAAHGDPPAPDSWLQTLAAAEPVRLLVRPAAQWIADYYPVADQIRRPDGDLEVTLPVADPAWLRWLLLRLGAGVTVLDAPAAVADAAAAARAALAAYTAAGLG